MKQVTFLLLFAVLLQHCGTKKTETAFTVDSVAVDSTSSTPAHALLAFNAIEGFTLDNKFALDDSVNIFLLSNQKELETKVGTSVTDPNFVINFVVAVACKPTMELTTIAMDKVELGTETIDVYLTILRGAQQKSLSKPTQIFAIERRGGFKFMQCFVNGKKGKAFLLDTLP